MSGLSNLKYEYDIIMYSTMYDQLVLMIMIANFMLTCFTLVVGIQTYQTGVYFVKSRYTLDDLDVDEPDEDDVDEPDVDEPDVSWSESDEKMAKECATRSIEFWEKNPIMLPSRNIWNGNWYNAYSSYRRSDDKHVSKVYEQLLVKKLSLSPLPNTHIYYD